MGIRISARSAFHGWTALALSGGLPPGLRQRDCDGPLDDLLDEYTATELWNICDLAQQETLCRRYLTERGDLLRDALLDDRASKPASGAAFLGNILWSNWNVFRSRRLLELLRRGEIRPNP
jgi:hypothetical protein